MTWSTRSPSFALGASLFLGGTILLGGAPTPLAAQVPGDPAVVAEVRTILEDPRVQAAFRYLEENDEETMNDLRTLTEIPAPPFMEEERGRHFRGRMEEIGVDSTWVDEEGNVIGLRRGAGRGLIVISAHLDTVFPEGTDVRIRQVGDTLFAPGIGDDTRGLTAVLAILRAMNASGIRTEQDVWFVGTVGEEGLGDLRGVKHLFREGGPPIDAFISIDGLGRHGITNAGLGSYRYRVTFEGPGGHSWGAFGLGNPIHALGRAVTRFDELASEFTSAPGSRTSYNVGRIGGGTSVNSIAFEAWMEVDMRSESPEALDAIDALFLQAMQEGLEEANQVRQRGEALTANVDKIGDRPSGEVSEDDPFLKRAIAATEVTGGLTTLSRSSTDSNIPIARGVPSITIGGGGTGANAHALEEYFINREGPQGIQRALLILLAQAGLATTM
jgi:tripeptide aminopeptidase